jgi:hypothetical protein
MKKGRRKGMGKSLSYPVPCGPSTAQSALSFASFCEKPFDLMAYQRTFPDRAAAYFRSTGMSAAELAVVFRVTERTAQNWLEGVVAPRGAAIAVIAARDPSGFAQHFGAAA